MHKQSNKMADCDSWDSFQGGEIVVISVIGCEDLTGNAHVTCELGIYSYGVDFEGDERESLLQMGVRGDGFFVISPIGV